MRDAFAMPYREFLLHLRHVNDATYPPEYWEDEEGLTVKLERKKLDRLLYSCRTGNWQGLLEQ